MAKDLLLEQERAAHAAENMAYTMKEEMKTIPYDNHQQSMQRIAKQAAMPTPLSESPPLPKTDEKPAEKVYPAIRPRRVKG